MAIDYTSILDSSNTKTTLGVYDQFKTPYFKVYIGDQYGNGKIPLPQQLARLISKIEITETIMPCHNSFLVVITLMEGSREPYSHDDSENTSDIYNGENNNLSNSTGMLADLVFNSSSGLLKSAGQAFKAVTQVASAAAGSLSSLSDENNQVFAGTTPNDNRTYLFQENNYIWIEWGYLEFPTSRTLVTQIRLVETTFPEKDQPYMVVTCLPLASYFDQMNPTKGKSYVNQIPWLGKELQPTHNFIPKTAHQTYQEINEVIDIHTSPQLLMDYPGKHACFNQPIQMSFHQFLTEMAQKHGAVYVALIDPKTLSPVIYMMSMAEFTAHTIISDPSLLTFRANGSILKSISIKADISAMTNNIISGIDDSGKVKTNKNGDFGESVAIADNAKLINNQPLHPELSDANDSILGSDDPLIVSHGENVPYANNTQLMTDRGKTRSLCQRKNNIGLEFTTLGYPLLRPGSVNFQGVGKRYSGIYTITTVTHTIDSNGYVCKGTAINYTIQDGTGYTPLGSPKIPDAIPSETANFTDESASNLSQSANALASNEGDISILSGDFSVVSNFDKARLG